MRRFNVTTISVIVSLASYFVLFIPFFFRHLLFQTFIFFHFISCAAAVHWVFECESDFILSIFLVRIFTHSDTQSFSTFHLPFLLSSSAFTPYSIPPVLPHPLSLFLLRRIFRKLSQTHIRSKGVI